MGVGYRVEEERVIVTRRGRGKSDVHYTGLPGCTGSYPRGRRFSRLPGRLQTFPRRPGLPFLCTLRYRTVAVSVLPTTGGTKVGRDVCPVLFHEPHLTNYYSLLTVCRPRLLFVGTGSGLPTARSENGTPTWFKGSVGRYGSTGT